MLPPKGGDSTSPAVPFLRKENVTSTNVDGVSRQKEGRCRAIHCRRSSSFVVGHTLPPPLLPVSPSKERRNAG